MGRATRRKGPSRAGSPSDPCLHYTACPRALFQSQDLHGAINENEVSAPNPSPWPIPTHLPQTCNHNLVLLGWTGQEGRGGAAAAEQKPCLGVGQGSSAGRWVV